MPARTLVAAGVVCLAACAEQPIEGGRPLGGAIAGAGAPGAAPRASRRTGDERPEFYVVQRGDTLFGIALDFGFDYRDLSQWNGLTDPDRILVGQRLRLTPPPPPPDAAEVRVRRSTDDMQIEPLPSGPPAVGSPSGSVTEGPVLRLSEPRAVTMPYTAEALAQWRTGAVDRGGTGSAPPGRPAAESAAAGDKPSAAGVAPPVGASAPAAAGRDSPARDGPGGHTDAPGGMAKPPAPKGPAGAGAEREDDEALEWNWPVRGDLLYRFGESGRLKGVGIGGRVGQPVAAAAAGRVVYAGSGLRGYGRMVIVKHNETYLSVYAHNSALLVKEGDAVRRGQRIAEMGDTDAPRVGLHFEVRRFGQPIDPLGRLPAL